MNPFVHCPSLSWYSYDLENPLVSQSVTNPFWVNHDILDINSQLINSYFGDLPQYKYGLYHTYNSIHDKSSPASSGQPCNIERDILNANKDNYMHLYNKILNKEIIYKN